jgi:hypothetical protein
LSQNAFSSQISAQAIYSIGGGKMEARPARGAAGRCKCLEMLRFDAQTGRVASFLKRYSPAQLARIQK